MDNNIVVQRSSVAYTLKEREKGGVVVGILPFSNTAGKQLFALNGISILSWNKQLLALGHARLQQSASVPGTGLWPRALTLSRLFESDHQEVGEAGERRGKGLLEELSGKS